MIAAFPFVAFDNRLSNRPGIVSLTRLSLIRPYIGPIGVGPGRKEAEETSPEEHHELDLLQTATDAILDRDHPLPELTPKQRKILNSANGRR